MSIDHADVIDGTVREPHADVIAERYVLGAVFLTSGRVMDTLAGTLRPEDFYRPVHEAIWRRMLAMHAKGLPLETTAFAATLGPDPIRGVDLTYLHACVQECVTPANADYYADQVVRPLARLRRITSAGAQIIGMANTSEPADVESTYSAALAALERAGTDVGDGELADAGSLMLEAMDRWDSPETGIIPTGLADLDAAFSGGFRPGHLMVIAARPAQGKSMVASVLARKVAAAGNAVFVSSQEMSRGEWIDRTVADGAGVNLTNLIRRCLSPRDWDAVARVHKESVDWPLVIDDRPNQSVAAIRGRVREVSRRYAHLGGVKVVFVDYLQLVAPTNDRAPRHEQVGGISRALKLMARELGVTVVALAQLNRGPEGRAEKRPVLADLRESGGIEADADEVGLLYHDPGKLGVVEFIVAKNRQGSVGTKNLSWQPQFARVASLASQVKP